MQELLVRFLKGVSSENFLALRRAHLAREEFQEAHDLIREHMLLNYFMSPGIHLMLGFVLAKLGNEEESEFERFFGMRLMEGIESTGEGSEERPYLVTRSSDEYDLLSARGLTMERQSLREHGGRWLDCLETNSGEPVWFDVTEVIGIKERG